MHDTFYLQTKIGIPWCYFLFPFTSRDDAIFTGKVKHLIEMFLDCGCFRWIADLTYPVHETKYVMNKMIISTRWFLAVHYNHIGTLNILWVTIAIISVSTAIHLWIVINIHNNTHIGRMEFMSYELNEIFNCLKIPICFLFWNVTSYKSLQHKYRLLGEFENKVLSIARIVAWFRESSRTWRFEWEKWVEIIDMHFPLCMNCPWDSPWWNFWQNLFQLIWFNKNTISIIPVSMHNELGKGRT